MKNLVLILAFFYSNAGNFIDEPLISEESFFTDKLSDNGMLDNWFLAESILSSPQIEWHLPSKASQSPNINFECTFCFKSFVKKTFLLRHLVSNHFKDKLFLQNFISHGGDPEKINYCDQCPFITLDKAHLAQHLARHSGQKLYFCDLCSRGFNLVNDLRRHKFSIHNKNVADFKFYSCTECSASFTRKNLLINHLAKHKEATKSDSMVSSGCIVKKIKNDLKLDSPVLLAPISHQASSLMSRQNYDFSIMSSDGVELVTNSNYQGQKEEKSHICSECGLKSGNKANLLIHMARHKKTPLYFCEFCQFRCYLKNDLSRHIISKHPRQVVANQGHVCNDCKLIFPRKKQLLAHEKIHQISFLNLTNDAGA
jgi:KRAB domain-containing zinc finger protein